jgi:hypothetical protein
MLNHFGAKLIEKPGFVNSAASSERVAQTGYW